MENKDIHDLLRMVGLFPMPSSNGIDEDDGLAELLNTPRSVIISKLMNVVLHTLGTIRKLVIEGEKLRVAADITDIDGTYRDNGMSRFIQRQIFARAVHTITDTIILGKDLNALDPLKDLIDSYPWAPYLAQPKWMMLNWALMENHLVDTGNPITSEDHVELVKKVVQHYPETMSEIDKFGNHYMSYVIRTNNNNILEEVLNAYSPQCLKLRDGKGRLAIHYAAGSSPELEPIIMIAQAIDKPLKQLCEICVDDYGNTPLHHAASGVCSVSVINELLFQFPDAIRMKNHDGCIPLHLACSQTHGNPISDVNKIQSLLAAFPNGISVPDRNGLLPLHHAAYHSKSVEVIDFLFKSYPDAMKKPLSINGRMPLHYAAVKCLSSKTMGYFLDIHPEAARHFDINGRLPLHNLVARCDFMTPARLKCLRLLLDVYPGAAGLSDRDGRTPLNLARRENLGDLVIRLLLKADPTQDPEALGEIAYKASRAKYRDDYDSKPGDDQHSDYTPVQHQHSDGSSAYDGHGGGSGRRFSEDTKELDSYRSYDDSTHKSDYDDDRKPTHNQRGHDHPADNK